MPRPLPDVSRLRLLGEVARHGSIAAAARSNRVTSSAVSQQISLLEREAGVPLVERRHRGVALTGAGQVLVDKAEQLRQILEETRTEMDQLTGEPSGRVRIGSIASAAMSIVLPAAGRVHAAFPEISVDVTVMEPSSSVAQVASGELDIAVMDIYDHVPVALPGHLQVFEILSEPLVLVSPKAGTRRSGQRLVDLRDARWVMPPASAACGQAVRHACREEGFEPDVAWETDDLLLLVESVAHEDRVALLPRLAVAKNLAGVRTTELAGRSLRRRILSVCRPSNAGRPVVANTLTALHALAR